MPKLTPHWTERSTDDFLYKIAADFVQQIENYLESSGDTQSGLADKLGVTPGRVSQVLNKPGNLTLRAIVQYARALGRKVALVAYDDNDHENTTGPVNSQVFEQCWIRAGRPVDLFAFEESDAVNTFVIVQDLRVPIAVAPHGSASNGAYRSYGITTSAVTDAENPPVRIPAGAGATNG